MRTGDVTNINHPQSFIDRGETLNISPINVTITTCPNRITKAIYTKLALNDVLTSRSFLNTPTISCKRLLDVLKYFALKRFQNCNKTKDVKTHSAHTH